MGYVGPPADSHRWDLRSLASHPSVKRSGQDLSSQFDLSAATDRWPVSTIHELVACIFGPTLASCIVNGCLGAVDK